MSKKHHLHYVLVADKSGSMIGQIDEVRREINLQVAKLRNDTTEDNPCSFTLRTFDSRVENVAVNVPIDKVPIIKHEDYDLGGTTALFDAIGSTIVGLENTVLDRIDGDKESLTMIVFSDGGENASSDFKADDIKKMLDKYENKNGFEIAFMGCDPQSFSDMDRVNMHYDRILQYSKGGESAAFASMSKEVNDIRFKRKTKFQLGDK
ncbi:MAG: hypothetical protein CL823_02070 [Crocinitomicaceae bacterium]|nr:hypothetical protein [Crocinitomicaceae bacterium]|tara:strand:+ start:1935 stop:2555 length:621 start_codon:yes stop_codon:yes gene_type:complete